MTAVAVTSQRTTDLFGAGETLTPMMVQYWEFKNQYPDALLFFRMGDFYELFFDDAVTAARVLDLTLTHRGKHQGSAIPMCGVPWHQADHYLHRLIAAGFTVAVCDQMETPDEARARGGHKALVRRDVTRLVTAGTITEDTLLDTRRNNFLAAVADVNGDGAVAWMDVSTGEFFCQAATGTARDAVLARLASREILVSDAVAPAALPPSGVKAVPARLFAPTTADQALRAFYGLSSLQPFGDLSRAEIAAAGALLQYVELTQRGKRAHVHPLRQVRGNDILHLDAATVRNLELVQTLSGAAEGSLLATIDRTLTAGGGRLLGGRLLAPLTQREAILDRQRHSQTLREHDGFLNTLIEHLKTCPDMERALVRISLDRAAPRDLAAIRDGLGVAATLFAAAKAAGLTSSPLGAMLDTLHGHSALTDVLTQALADPLPAFVRDGGVVRHGYSAALDDYRQLRHDSQKHVLALQQKYVALSGVASLKVKNNQMFGYFIEVPPKQADRMATGTFIHRQTLASAVRYTTPELAELEARITKADTQALALEREIFDDLCARVRATAGAITTAAQALAALDVAQGFARLMREDGYICPEIADDATLVIEQGRHPVVEAARRTGAQQFVANTLRLEATKNLWLMTGPNMAGKSTFLRQNALIVILAQMGGVVPAAAARIGLVDQIFSRVGAADDLARGHSTFMVEMVETAAILHQATARSLVILDEIGRGTATYDGLSIAWATLEHVHTVNRCRALFATHYHELTALQDTLERLACHTMRVEEWNDTIVFLHEVVAGHADRSYGIHVAQLAGLPAPVIARARGILHQLESAAQTRTVAIAPPAADTPPAEHPLVQKLRAVRPDALTPREALDLLYDLVSDLPASNT